MRAGRPILAGTALAALAAGGAWGAAGPAAMTLHARDLLSYAVVAGQTGPVALSDLPEDDSPATASLRRRTWVGGYRSTLSNAKDPNAPVLVSNAARYRSAAAAQRILDAAAARLRRGPGTVVVPMRPPIAPGARMFRQPLTLNGTRYDVLNIGWRRGPVILSLQSVAPPGQRPGLAQLAARRQDARVRAALR